MVKVEDFMLCASDHNKKCKTAFAQLAPPASWSLERGSERGRRQTQCVQGCQVKHKGVFLLTDYSRCIEKSHLTGRPECLKLAAPGKRRRQRPEERRRWAEAGDTFRKTMERGWSRSCLLPWGLGSLREGCTLALWPLQGSGSWRLGTS